MFVRNGSAPAESAETANKEKQKGLKAMMGKLSSKIFKENKDVKAVSAIKLLEMVDNFLADMKKKDEEHQKTAEEAEAWKTLSVLKAEYDQYIKDYNDAYKRQPKYHMVMQNTANAKAAEDSKYHIAKFGTDAKVTNCRYTLQNNKSIPFNYVVAGGKAGIIKPGEQIKCLL